jgi:hypothetical protein
MNHNVYRMIPSDKDEYVSEQGVVIKPCIWIMAIDHEASYHR